MSEAHASDISTHFYKLGHLGKVNYYIYTSTTNNDQSLLELELTIRYEHPKLLITYYNKSLYYFTFNDDLIIKHESIDENDEEKSNKDKPLDLEKAYPNLQLKHSSTVLAENLSYPPKSGVGVEPTDDFLPFANISFLKAVKKMVFFNLSTQGILKLFGNHSVLVTDSKRYTLIYMDPILLSNGDLLLSIIQKESTNLFESSIIEPDQNGELTIESNFVIYLVPSGIRCHLFDPTDLNKNFISKKITENDSLLHLLKLCTGIDYSNDSESEITWIKLVPNLKHLNNQTSPISKFIHSVDNKKFILWPWNLCLLQFGKYEKHNYDNLNQLQQQHLQNSSDPLSLISDLLDFNISRNQSHQLQPHQPQPQSTHPYSISSVASSLGGGIGSVEPSTILEQDQQKDLMEIHDITTPMVPEMFPIPNPDASFFNKNDNVTAIDFEEDNNYEKKEDDEMEIDDLFGDDTSENNMETKTPKELDEENAGDNINSISSNESKKRDDFPLSIDNNVAQELDDLFNTSKDNNSQVSNGRNNSIKPSSFSYIDIPKDQMTIKRLNTPDYDDPGAPLPIMPTPNITHTTSAYPTNPPTAAPVNNEYPGSGDDNNKPLPHQSQPLTQKSVFSPILFNPIIKSNIDTKYGKGGKFYVDKEVSVDPDTENKSKMPRATSVSGFDRPSRKDILEDYKLSQLEKSVVISDDSQSSASEESDEDEDEDEIMKSPPLKLNTMNESFTSRANATINGTSGILGVPVGITNSNDSSNFGPLINNNDKNSLGFSNFNTGGFASPNTTSINRLPLLKIESPFATELHQAISPMDYDRVNSQNAQQFTPPQITTSRRLSASDDSLKSISESSNYLPLILRNINVSSVPNTYYVNNLVSKNILTNFSINDDENENDLELVQDNEMIVNRSHINELLDILVPNLVFDLNQSKSTLPTDYYVDSSYIFSFEHKFFEVFPYSYRVRLSEFLFDYKELETTDELDRQLGFLEGITDDDVDVLNPKAQYKKLKSLEWNGILFDDKTQINFEKYKVIIDKLNSNVLKIEDVYFKLPPVKTKVLKNNSIVNLDSLGLNYWKYLNFSPIKAEKNFQILLVAENDGSRSFMDSFLNMIIHNYKECNFGTITKVNLSTVDTRPDLDSITNGVFLVNREGEQSYNDIYVQLNKKLNSLVELIKLDLINKTNNFEFDRPLLLFFINFNEKMNSLLQISKILRNFKVSLTNHQLPLVRVFTKIISGDFMAKKQRNQSRLKILSNFKLTKLSMNLYNQCPNDLANKELVKNNYTLLVKEPPTKIQFKFINANFKESNFNDDIFLHLAYERSIDKNWFSVAWSDPLGMVSYSKSWYCASSQERPSSEGTAHDVAGICDQIWAKSNELFKKLNDEFHSKSSTLGGKKFLVLTRVNNVIPDDELVHWKRLSVKHKDVSLIVLSVSSSPKLIFQNESIVQSQKPDIDIHSGITNSNINNFNSQFQSSGSGIDREFHFRAPSSSNNASPNTSQSNLVTSPNGLTFHSPQQFLNAPGNFLSPSELLPSHNSSKFNDSEYLMHELGSDIVGIVPRLSLPSFNSPTRLGIKVGYLLKELSSPKATSKLSDYLMYEVTLLSCSNYWDLDSLMKLLLNQYKKLITLNEILGLRDIDGNIVGPQSDNYTTEATKTDRLNFEVKGLVPWHISAVTKTLDYLVHIYVEE
ncbi:mediator of RNA polymerase II transcription subunit 13 [Scheffersomyces coipomensis]|uniref:mediator of RNA polymerase II transcription subunit 13 n=1 Tax=Scheffersomyces coipomensis TaxID=1788519 RepID=UPI00315C57B6